MNKLNDLVALCRNHPVYIQTHNFPDPDAIASAYGLQKLLALYGVESRLCYDGRIDKLSASKMLDAFQIQMSPYEKLRADMLETDPIIYVDTQKHGGNVTDFIGDEVACIDHHPTFIPCEYRYSDIRLAGACSSLIAEYFYKTDTPMNPTVAAALAYGIKIDTADFIRGTTQLDIDMFAYVYKQADKDKITTMYRNTLELRDLQAYGAAIDNIHVRNGVGFACIPFDCPDALIAILSDFILALVEVEVAIVYSYREDGVKFSVRSEDDGIHAGNLVHDALEEIGSGGGHAFMAGGLIRREQMEMLGRYPEDAIRDLFLKILDGKLALKE